MRNKNPYLSLSDKSFWKKAVVEKTPEKLDNIYRKKFKLNSMDHIATAGSCFAQHVSRSLKKNGFNVLDKEGSEYSANYGNIYTVAQLLQLTRESISESPLPNIAWEKDGQYIDALRPGALIPPVNSPNEVMIQRLKHLQAVRAVLQEFDVFIFTLGLTEAWIRKEDNVVFPSAPGVIAGDFDPDLYEFRNYDFNSIVTDFEEFIEKVTILRAGKAFKIILTVSPVPLTATASKDHILIANTYSKATLRAVAAQLAEKDSIDYFPSYEIVTNPKYYQESYDANLRTVKKSTVDNVMHYFFSEHQPIEIDASSADNYDVQCEDQILEMYSGIQIREETTLDNARASYVEMIGDSHMNSLVKALKSSLGKRFSTTFCVVDRRVLKNGINPN